jgi:hypothetical protein
MKVFISWSGERSHAVALVLKDWVSSVIQAAKPWLSSADIQRGAQWMGDIGTQLHESTVGIFCLTSNNKNAPWILFEAGAVAKGVSSNRICTLLIDLEPTSVLGPLAQFNHTKPNKEDMLKLAATLNFALGENKLTEFQLERSFEAHWNRFETDFENAVQLNPETQGPAPKPKTDDLLFEILSTVRSLSSRLSEVEKNRSKILDPSSAYPFPTEEKVVSDISTSDGERWVRLTNVERAMKARRAVLNLKEKEK